jgi:hypothetical protein
MSVLSGARACANVSRPKRLWYKPAARGHACRMRRAAFRLRVCVPDSGRSSALGSVTLVPPERATNEIGEIRLTLPQQYSRRRRLRRLDPMGAGGGQMTADIEGVVTGRVAGKETLHGAGRSKTLDLSLSSSDRHVRASARLFNRLPRWWMPERPRSRSAAS